MFLSVAFSKGLILHLFAVFEGGTIAFLVFSGFLEGLTAEG